MRYYKLSFSRQLSSPYPLMSSCKNKNGMESVGNFCFWFGALKRNYENKMKPNNKQTNGVIYKFNLKKMVGETKS